MIGQNHRSQVLCPLCRLTHEWFAKDAWICDPLVCDPNSAIVLASKELLPKAGYGW